jgi:predicted nucleotide-binding protein
MTINPTQQEILILLTEDELNLKKIYTEDYLKEAPAVLEFLLDEEKQKFAAVCALPDKDITFDTIHTNSLLGMYF